jgi:hypothetical protein
MVYPFCKKKIWGYTKAQLLQSLVVLYCLFKYNLRHQPMEFAANEEQGVQ